MPRDSNGDAPAPTPVTATNRAVLRATKVAAVAVEEGAKPLADYMRLPVSQYSVLDAKRIERLDDTTFRCHVGGLRLFSFTVEPVLTLSVVVGERGPVVQLLETRLEGSKVVQSVNDKFSATMTNVVRWRENENQEGGKELTSDTVIQVEIEVPTWFRLVPKSAIETTGSGVMHGVLNTAVPRFLEQLRGDYMLWAKGER